MKHLMLASVATLGLAGCVTSDSGDTILALPEARARTASIGDIVLTGAPTTVSPEFAGILQTRLREKLSACATGVQPLRLEVRVLELKGANPAMAYLAGDSNVIRAQVVLIEPATGLKVADYDVSRSVGGGGLFAAIAMTQAEEQMSSALGDDICDRAFGGRNRR